MATKRLTDAEKWKDPFFENLSNDFKLIWLYLLDDCDNAGLWNRSIKRLNYHCNTTITEEDLIKVFKERLQPLTEDTWYIPKFNIFQYGVGWIDSKSKAVISAKNKLEQFKSIIDRVSIPYPYPIHTLKDKDKDKDQDKSKDKSKDKDKAKDKAKELPSCPGIAPDEYKDNPKIKHINKLLSNVDDFDKMFKQI